MQGWGLLYSESAQISPGWFVEGDAIRRDVERARRAGYLIWTEHKFGDFELSWKWKIAPGGNSGVKYRVANFNGRWLGCEYQLLDDTQHSNASDPTKRAGALYGLYAPNPNKKLKPVGQYNQSRVVARGSRIEHWLNGSKILEFDTSSRDWCNRVCCSKFCEYAGFGQNAAGFVMLQDHGDDVWFRDLVVRVLED